MEEIDLKNRYPRGLERVLGTTSKDEFLKRLGYMMDEAAEHHDGHFTILGFTTHIKVAYGTPSFLISKYDTYMQIPEMTHAKNLSDAILGAREMPEVRWNEY